MATGGMSISLIWTNASSFVAKLQGAIVKGNVELAAALYQEGQAIMRDTLPITPIDLGGLRSSGHVEAPTPTGPGEWEVVLGFGGSAAPYALYVHEIMTAQHDPPTQAKFLETTMNEHAKDFAARMALLMKVPL